MQADEVNRGQERHVPLTFGQMCGVTTLHLQTEGTACVRGFRVTKASYYLSLMNPLRTYLSGIST